LQSRNFDPKKGANKIPYLDNGLAVKMLSTVETLAVEIAGNYAATAV